MMNDHTDGWLGYIHDSRVCVGEGLGVLSLYPPPEKILSLDSPKKNFGPKIGKFGKKNGIFWKNFDQPWRFSDFHKSDVKFLEIF